MKLNAIEAKDSIQGLGCRLCIKNGCSGKEFDCIRRFETILIVGSYNSKGEHQLLILQVPLFIYKWKNQPFYDGLPTKGRSSKVSFIRGTSG
jgi:hypothetical protein